MGPRSLLFALALVFASQTTGVLEALGEHCAAPCDIDDDEGHCPPTCASCSCAPRLNEPVRVVALLPAPEPRVVEPMPPLEAPSSSPGDGFAEEIAHVPIA